MSAAAAVFELDGHRVEVSRPDKVLFAGAGITKRDLAEHHARIAEVMLPHVAGRPVTMQRHPDGIDQPGFYQQDTPDHFPDWVTTVPVAAGDRELDRLVIDSAAVLVLLADQACITPHVWLSTIADLDRPDRLVVDLDPPDDARGGGDVDEVRFAARAVRELLDELGLASRLMTTGSSGFHVVVPLAPAHDVDDVRAAARALARVLARRHPDRLTTEHRIVKRAGRVYLDVGRNARGQTTVAPYAVRARAGAPVATPIGWHELGRTEPRTYTMANIFRRLGQIPDPWSVDGISPQRLGEATSRIAALAEA